MTRALFLALTLLSANLLFGQPKSFLGQYTNCRFNVFQIAQTDRLPGPMARTLKTKSGEQDVQLLDGYRVLITYEQTEPFVNMKVEQLDLATYPRDKTVLIENLGVTAAGTQGMESNTPRHQRIGRFDVYSINRTQLVGGVLGIYTLFNDDDRTVTTIYFLNAEPAERKFQTVAAYRTIRDDFLKQFSACLPPTP